MSARLLVICFLVMGAWWPARCADAAGSGGASLEAGVANEYAILNERAQLRWQRAEYDKALDLLRQMVALRPDEPTPYYAIGQILGNDGPLFDQAESLKAFNTYLRLATGDKFQAQRAKVQAFVMDLEDGRRLSLGKATPVAPAGAKAGEVKAVQIAPGVFLDLVYVPAGRFTMGSPAGEAGRHVGEIQREVSLSRGFWLGRTEVTQAQWRALMGTNASAIKGDDLPVTNLSWTDAQNFIRNLNSRVPGGGFSLPTEAQWEYACRAGTTGPFAENPDAAGWHVGNSGMAPHPVGRKKPNAWGLHDLHGNVWEWCQDWAADYRPGAAIDPTGPVAGTERIVRGGSYACVPAECRSSHRNRVAPATRLDTVGLRLLKRE